MTEFEKELRVMLTEKENDLLDRVVGKSPHRHGCIASLVASRLRWLEETGMMDAIYPELEKES